MKLAAYLICKCKGHADHSDYNQLPLLVHTYRREQKDYSN